jgi:hypothetical protein
MCRQTHKQAIQCFLEAVTLLKDANCTDARQMVASNHTGSLAGEMSSVTESGSNDVLVMRRFGRESQALPGKAETCHQKIETRKLVAGKLSASWLSPVLA